MKSQPEDLPAKLTKRVTDLLDGCLGAIPFPSGTALRSRRRLIPLGPLLIGPYTGLIYALLFCALPWLFFGRPERHLFWLSVFGSLYAAWATTIARSTSAKILEIIKSRIIPELSVETVGRIDSDLARRFEEKRLLQVSWTIALLGALAAGWAISRDVPNALFQIAWWCVGWLFLFVTAAKATNVARFYYVFAEHLEKEPNIYVFDPARSALVKDIAAVGRHVLLFWVGIAVSIALLIPFASIGSDEASYANWRFLSAPSIFVLLVVPITSAFSIPFGTYVFLRSERMIGNAVDKVVHATLRSTEREISDLFARRSDLNEFQWRRMNELASLHTSLTTAGSYRNFLISGLSLLVPLIGPVVALLKVFYNTP